MKARSGSAASARAIVKATADQDLDRLTRALARHHGPVPAQAMVKAGGLAWTPGLKRMVKAGGDVNATFKNYRALHALIQEEPHAASASTHERIACLEWLLTHGADPELPAAWPAARALVIAAFEGDERYVDVLRQAIGRLDIFTAAALGEAGTVRALLDADASLATARDGGLLTALQCCGGSKLGVKDAATADSLLECARLLVDAGADVNAWTRSWAHAVSVSYFVIRSGQVRMLELLLGRGLNATDAVAAAAWDSRPDILDLLIAHGADLRKAFDRTRPVLNELVRWGQFAAARTYLARGPDPNLTDDRGWTAVHQVTSRGNLKMLQDLLAAGGDPNRADHDGRTPRGMAKASHRADLVKAMDAARPRSRPAYTLLSLAGVPTDAGRQTLGKLGESLARATLRQRGYTILATRYRSRFGEIDIVSEHAGVVVFVEVKARRSARRGTAADAVPPIKRRRIAAMALDYLAWTGRLDAPCRFDVVAIDRIGADDMTIRVIENAWQVDR